jgi:hypothetical protein
VRVEAVLLTVLVFAGVNVAWVMLFEETTTGRASLAESAWTISSKAKEPGPAAGSPNFEWLAANMRRSA